MPGTQQGTHPTGRVITFEEAAHTYTDDRGNSYRSFTRLIHDYFPQFDAPTVAARIAEKRGTTPETLMAEWKRDAAEACEYGTRTHENCEFRLKGLPEPNTPRNDKERATFQYAAAAVDALKAKFQFVAAEKILFSPRCGIAGTVDLLMADGGTLWILDWKTNREIKREAFGDETGFFPLQHLPNCNFFHYAIQLSLAEVVAKMEGYVPHDTQVRRALIHLPPMAPPQWIETPDFSAECYEMIVDYVAHENPPF